MAFRVEFSARAERDLARLIEDSLDRYTPQQSLAYVEAIRIIYRSLDQMPHRFQRVPVNRRELRRFNHKAHAIFYRIIEENRRVVIEAVLRATRDFRRYL